MEPEGRVMSCAISLNEFMIYPFKQGTHKHRGDT